jgi:hypothetical protein
MCALTGAAGDALQEYKTYRKEAAQPSLHKGEVSPPGAEKTPSQLLLLLLLLLLEHTV